MVIAGIFQTVEFYVIVCVIAAAVVALAALPSKRGEAQLHMAAGELSEDCGDSNAATLHAICNDDGSVTLRRTGLHGMTASGAVSLAATVIGFDVSIQERLSAGYRNDTPTPTATFRLDFLARERYHITYRSEDTGLFAAFTLSNRPGLHVTKQLL